VRRLEGYQGEVEGAVELVGVSVGFDPHPTFLAQVVYEEAVSSYPLDVLFIGVEHGDALHLARHLRRRYPADGARADD
jgi:hypothetical protein